MGVVMTFERVCPKRGSMGHCMHHAKDKINRVADFAHGRFATEHRVYITEECCVCGGTTETYLESYYV